MANAQELKVAEQFINGALVNHRDPSSFIKNVTMFLKAKHCKKNPFVQEQFVRSMLIFSINSSLSLRTICTLKASSSTVSQLEAIVEKLIEIAENRDDFSKRTRAISIYMIAEINPESCQLLGSLKRTSSWSLARRVSLYKPPSLIDLPSKSGSRSNLGGKFRFSLKENFENSKLFQPKQNFGHQTPTLTPSHIEMFLEMIEGFFSDNTPDLYSITLLTKVLIAQNYGKQLIDILKDDAFKYMFKYFSKDYEVLNFSDNPDPGSRILHAEAEKHPDSGDSHNNSQHMDDTLSPEKSYNPIEEIVKAKNYRSQWANPDLLELNQCLALYSSLITPDDDLASYLLSVDETCFEQLATKLYPNCLLWMDNHEHGFSNIDPELTFILKMTSSMVFTIVDKVIYGYFNGYIKNPNCKMTDLDIDNTIDESSEQ